MLDIVASILTEKDEQITTLKKLRENLREVELNTKARITRLINRYFARYEEEILVSDAQVIEDAVKLFMKAWELVSGEEKQMVLNFMQD